MKIQFVSYLGGQADSVLFQLNSVCNNGCDEHSHKNSHIQIDNNSLLSPLDRAFNYGDGCFTTMYAEKNQICLLERHLTRLHTDAQRLYIKLDINLLKNALIRSCQHIMLGAIGQCVLKIHVSRGLGGRGYQLPEDGLTQVLISFHQCNPSVASLSDKYQYKIEIAQLQLSTQPRLAGIKHLNRLEQILAKHDLQTRQADDLLLCDQANNVIEATAANLFIKAKDTWYTPDLQNCGVAGVFRQAILDYLIAQQRPAVIKALSIQDIQDADSVFVCNALAHIVPVSHFTLNQETNAFNMHLSIELWHAMADWLSQQHHILRSLNKKDEL